MFNSYEYVDSALNHHSHISLFNRLLKYLAAQKQNKTALGI